MIRPSPSYFKSSIESSRVPVPQLHAWPHPERRGVLRAGAESAALIGGARARSDQDSSQRDRDTGPGNRRIATSAQHQSGGGLESSFGNEAGDHLRRTGTPRPRVPLED